MYTERMNEIVSTMKSFTKDCYERRELLEEMFSLQDEMVNLTFSREHADSGKLRVWDIERHFEQLSANNGDVAKDLLERFKAESKEYCNLIKAEVSGSKGEARAFRSLDSVKSQNRILKNVELQDGDLRGELDAVVITPKGITIVEVKNTAREIFIDESGNYYKIGEFLKLHCNISDKMFEKKALLGKALADLDISNVPVNCILVFTDNSIQVQNKNTSIKTCFVSQLPYLIDEMESDATISGDLMNAIADAITAHEKKEAYPIKFNINQYKRDFAELLATLEDANSKKEVKSEESKAEEVITARPVKRRSRRSARYLGGAAAAVATFIIGCTFAVIKKGVA